MTLALEWQAELLSEPGSSVGGADVEERKVLHTESRGSHTAPYTGHYPGAGERTAALTLRQNRYQP
jgi:hypothetical protein